MHEVIFRPFRKQLYGRANMTDSQKQQIVEMRKKGFGYTAIANELGTTKDCVRMICRRLKIAGKASESTNCFCRNCGKRINENHLERTKIFCSNKCRMSWWNKHRKTKPAICECCGKPYDAYTDTRFCSHECYVNFRFYGGKK